MARDAGSAAGPDVTVPGQMARAGAGLIAGGLDWARAMDDLAEELLAADGPADGPADAGGPAGRAGTPLDAAISVRRLAIERPAAPA
jgi:hypothetical protein